MPERKKKVPSNFSVVKNISCISVFLAVIAILASVFCQAGRGLILLAWLSVELFLFGYKFFSYIGKE